MRPRFMLLQKGAIEDEDGALTPAGMAIAQRYARRWVADGVRDLETERQYPTLGGLFYDIRSDPDLAREHASEEKPIRKSLEEQIVMVRPEIATVPVHKLLSKAGGPYIGERGGKWADPQHTIHWEEATAKQAKTGGEEAAGGKPAAAPEAAGEQKTGAPAAAGEKQSGAGAEAPVEPIKVEHKHVPLTKKTDYEGKRGWVTHYPGLPKATVSAYTLPTPEGQPRQYIPERAQMHEAIMADAFRGKHPVPAGQKPVAIMMMGGGASGKSTLVRKQFEEKGLLGNFVTINSDDVKEQLPEYDIATKDPKKTAMDAAAMVHEESSDVAGQMLARASDPSSKYNFVFDGTGANARKYGDIMDRLKSLGYHIHLMYADVENPDDAWRRSESRADKTGRWVPEEMLRGAHASIPQNFEGLASKVDSYGMYALPKDGGHKEIMTGQGGRHEIHDAEYLGNFRQRADKLRTEEAAKKAQKAAAAPAPAPAGGGTVPSKTVAKSMTAAYNQGEMKKAFPPQQQKPQERFVMTRPGGAPPPPQAGATPPPGAPPATPPAAPPAAAPQAGAPRPPMPPQAAAPRPPQATPPVPPAAPPGGAPGASPAAAPEAPANTSTRISPDFDINDFHQAVLSSKSEPVKESKGERKLPEGHESVPFPEDDFSWAVEALDRSVKKMGGQAGAPAATPATPPAAPAAANPPSAPQPGQPVQTPPKPLT